MNRYQPLLFQPVPSLLGFSLTETVEEMRAVHFPDLDEQIEVRIASEGALAFVQRQFMGPQKHLVVFHPVLNHPETPVEVLRFIAKHELTHLARPGRLIDGAYESHPPEFWEHEYAIGPERYAVWAWIHKNLNRCARSTKRGYRVRRSWHAHMKTARTPYTPSLPFNGERWERACPGDGAQMHFPPDWAALPLPFVGV